MLSMRESGRIEPSFPNPERTASGAPALALARSASLPLVACALALGGVLLVSPVRAIEIGQGEVQGSLDTTISHGMTWRVEEQEERVRNFLASNSNDGNLNYGRGLVSNTSKFTTDLDLGYRNYGLFVRATGYLDFENEDGRGDRTAFGPEAADLLDHEVDILDAYVTGAFDVGDTALDLRVGSHVLNWGESSFIQNGINAFNRFDVSKLRLPGSELREALVPIPMVSLSAAPSYNLSVEGFYQFDWEETVIDPVGSYFSTTDYAGPGAREAVIANADLRGLLGRFGSDFDRHFTFGPLRPAINLDLQGYTVDHPQFGPIPFPLDPEPEVDSDFMTVMRGPDRTPGDSGQWGAALRYLAEDLNDTEFGLYVANYHSRLPTVRARTAPREGIEAGLAAASAVFAPTSYTRQALTAAVSAQILPAVQAGLLDPAAAQERIEEEVAEQAFGIGVALALDRYAETSDSQGERGSFFLEYPENVRLLGLSFNTALGTSGWALQGDYALHMDAPLQRAERTLLEEGLSPMTTALQMAAEANATAAAARGLAAEAAQDPTNPAAPILAQQAQALAARARELEASLQNYLMTYEPTDIRGYIRHDVSQIQATATRVFGPVFGADAFVFVTEAALMHVHSMTDEALEGPARPSELGNDPDGDADATSWGYRMAARLDYNNAVGAVNLFPYVQWRHDVNGNSPAPSGQFSEGLNALTLGLGADYLSSWRADLSYTRFGGRRNTLRDRDFITASINYSF